MAEKYVSVYSGYGALDAETVRLFLVSNGINARVLQESAGTVYGLTLGPLGAAEVLVPESQADEARDLIERMEEGQFIQPGDEDEYSDYDEDFDDESEEDF